MTRQQVIEIQEMTYQWNKKEIRQDYDKRIICIIEHYDEKVKNNFFAANIKYNIITSIELNELIEFTKKEELTIWLGYNNTIIIQ